MAIETPDTTPTEKDHKERQTPSLTAPAPAPTGKLEYTDGASWFNLATENFVLNSISSMRPVLAATTTNLAATYVNGTAGVGATLTSTTNAVLTVDGVTPALNARILVKDQTTTFQNGIYTLTTVGSSTVPWVLTRAADADSPSQILQGWAVDVATGTVNGVTSWMQTAVVTAVGTSAITFALLAKNGIQNVVGTTNQITVTIANNIATLSLATNPVLPGTGGATMPGGSTAQRPGTLTAGTIRFNNGT